MLHVVTTGAYYLPVVTTWKILTTEASYLTTGTLCNVPVVNNSFIWWYNPQTIMIIVPNALIYVHRASICEHILSSLPSPRRNVIYWVPFSHTHLLDCNDDTLRPGSRNESKILLCWRVIVLKSFSNLFKICTKLTPALYPLCAEINWKCWSRASL